MTVHFVGAGPGASDVLTLRGRDMIVAADAVLYAGSLVPVAVVAHARDDAMVIDSADMALDKLTACVHDAHQAGKNVARVYSVATMVTEPRRGIAQAVVISGMEAIGELTGSESFDTLIETSWEMFEEQVAVTPAEGLAAGAAAVVGLIDIALALGTWELRPRAMTAGEWLWELVDQHR